MDGSYNTYCLVKKYLHAPRSQTFSTMSSKNLTSRVSIINFHLKLILCMVRGIKNYSFFPIPSEPLIANTILSPLSRDDLSVVN